MRLATFAIAPSLPVFAAGAGPAGRPLLPHRTAAAFAGFPTSPARLRSSSRLGRPGGPVSKIVRLRHFCNTFSSSLYVGPLPIFYRVFPYTYSSPV